MPQIPTAQVIPILINLTTDAIGNTFEKVQKNFGKKTAGVYHLEIIETQDELKKRLRNEKTAFVKERLQALYLLKTKKAKTVKEVAEMLGRNRVTIQDWLALYRQGGVEKLLKKKVSSGRPRKIPSWAEKA